MRTKAALFASVFSLLVSGQILANEFQKGAGSKFKLVSQGQASADLNIYISESSFSKLGVEYYFSAGNGIFGKQMWQQFIFELVDKGPVNVTAGYVQTPGMSNAETLTAAHLNVNKGVQVDDFLFSNRAAIDKFKIGEEKVEVPAGSVTATHYRKQRSGQTVDFWISHKVKPIGLVKLISKSEKSAEQNYTIELITLLRNVKAKIDPKKAGPLTEKGRAAVADPRK